MQPALLLWLWLAYFFSVVAGLTVYQIPNVQTGVHWALSGLSLLQSLFWLVNHKGNRERLAFSLVASALILFFPVNGLG
jgi:hypothetical protein